MKKVFFSVVKAGRNEQRMSGVGYITDEDLLVPTISRNGKAYIRVFEDCFRYCHAMPKSPTSTKVRFTKSKRSSLKTVTVRLKPVK